MSDFPYKAPPMQHQVNSLKRAWKKNEFALFHEMGTGKTFTVINLAAARFLKGQINALVVICPTPIKLVWESELEKWCPVPYESFVLVSGKKSAEELIYFTATGTDSLKVVVVGVEALSQGNAFTLVQNFVSMHKVMVACDESSRLKNPKAERTKRAIKIASRSLYRIIMTGTPITQGVEDLYGQFMFLNPKIIGCRSFFVFKNMYCILKSFDKFDKIVGYQNMEDLMGKVSPYVDVIKKEDVLDLPPKVYEKIIVDPTPAQMKLINSLKDMFIAEHKGEELLTETILERLTRFQQIIGGNFPFDKEDGTHGVMPIDGPNPKLKALIEVLEDLPCQTKVIIWARFVPEIELIEKAISNQWPDLATTFYGRNDDQSRKDSVESFQNGSKRFMISNPQVGGMGQTWTAATVVIYYSNSFSYEDRKQSEDRAHRKGQENTVTYVDIEANHPYDRMILSAITRKGGVAAEVNRRIEENQS